MILILHSSVIKNRTALRLNVCDRWREDRAEKEILIMIYRPPFKGLWKQLSLFILLMLGLGILVFFFQILSQQKELDNIRSTTVNGIVQSKRDLQRGSFGFTVKENNVIKEFDMAGLDYFFEKLEIGDSISKQPNTYFFDVYKKVDSKYKFVTTIGYE